MFHRSVKCPELGKTRYETEKEKGTAISPE
jgi:hypothetical protein